MAMFVDDSAELVPSAYGEVHDVVEISEEDVRVRTAPR